MTTFNPLGCYKTSDGKTWESKRDALVHASRESVVPSFYFHDHVWSPLLDTVNTVLGKKSLDSLYRDRCLQLRDKYDYLCLHYSGGSDSHNILMSFINNKIPLDEVIVKWSSLPKDRNLYKPNTWDVTAKNSLSEWDYTIEPSLQWLRKNHPNIKVTVIDFLNDFSESTGRLSSKLESLKLSRGAFASFVQRYSSKVEYTFSEGSKAKGSKRSAHIFGIEKPLLSIKDNKIYFQFTDVGLETSVLEDVDLTASTELFYWTPDLPLLPLEQAYQASLLLKYSKEHQAVLYPAGTQNLNQANAASNAQSNVFKTILYPTTWDITKFQAGKPNVLRSDWWWWVHANEDLKDLQARYNKELSVYNSTISDKYLILTSETTLLKPLATKLFYLMDL